MLKVIFVIASFSIINISYMLIFANFPTVQPEFKWAWKIGIAVGIFVSLSIPFLLWLYYIVGVFLITSFLSKVPSFSPIARIVGFSFFFLFLGRSISTGLQIGGISPDIAQWIYTIFLIWALIEMMLGLKSILEISGIDAAFAVVVPTFVLEVFFLLF